MGIHPEPDPVSQAILIRDARLVDPSVPLDGVCHLLAISGEVVEVGENLTPERAGKLLTCVGLRPSSLLVIDGTGLWLWPGLVDGHVHFREPGFAEKETFATGGQAAAAGGYTSVVCEPNTEPALDTPTRIRQAARRAAASACIRVYLKAAMTKGRAGKAPVDFGTLAAMPEVAAFSDDGDPVVSVRTMEEVCRAAAEANALLTPHCEDSPQALRNLLEVDPGFQPQEPYTNESQYIERDLGLAERHRCRIHFSHVSLGGSVRAITDFRRRSAAADNVTFEVTPHHLLLSADDFTAERRPCVTPPLRSAADREALQSALANGIVDGVASDHAPHTARDKQQGASGLIGIETTLGIVLTHFVSRGRLSALAAADVLSTAPARILRLPAGSLRPGAAADMVLIDPEREWIVRPEEFFSKARNCAFAGWKLIGRALCTLVAGRIVYAHESLHGRISTMTEDA